MMRRALKCFTVRRKVCTRGFHSAFLPQGLTIQRFYRPDNQIGSVSNSFSSWQYPEIPWRRVSEKDIEKAKKLVELQKKRDDLTRAVQSAVRTHLRIKYPNVFNMTRSRSIWKNFRTKELNDNAKTLLALNGFENVPLPQPMDMLLLAEGVVAFPNFYSRVARSQEQKKFLLLSQPIVKDSKGDKKAKSYPEIIQEDIQLYRVLENQAEQLLNAVYNTMDGLVQIFIRYPIELILRRLEAMVNLLKATLNPQIEEDSPTLAPHPSIRLPSMVDQSQEATENLLVIGESRDEMLLYAHMSPSVRLVALPYTLGHKSASTLVSVSLVLFGALPLAYRSLNYAHLYPGLSEALAASVIGTISYGIWSQRYNARISQSRVLSDAMLHRIQARDDAAVLLLQEGAVRQVSQAVLSEYFTQLETKKTHKYATTEDQELLARLAPPRVSVASPNLADPSSLAKQLGLVFDLSSGSGTNVVSLDDAVSKVEAARAAMLSPTEESSTCIEES